MAIKLANYFDIDVGSFISTKQVCEIKNKDYIKLLKGKELMDENGNINEESLNKLLKMADILDGTKKEK